MSDAIARFRPDNRRSPRPLRRPACVTCALGAWLAAATAHAYCVHDTGELNSALAEASTGGSANGHDNTIRVAAGTYATSGGPFTFTSTSGFALTLEGGYDATCAAQDFAPGTSVLDGGGTNEVVSIQTNGSVTVSRLTIQNGFRDGSSNGGGVGIVLNRLLTTDPVPMAMFSGNVVRNNSSNYAVGGMSVFATAPMPDTPVGAVVVEDNLFVGNSAPSVAALFIDLGPGSTAYLTNNTITANTCSSPNTAVTAIGDNAGAVAGYVSNTISHGNSASYDYYLYINDSVEFTNNKYDSIKGSPSASSSGNLIGVDPLFASITDFHLRSTSPLLRAGAISPPGGLAAHDLDGHARSAASHVDIGAYENLDFIFANGFDIP